ncbi:DUF2071 domain-containing protein [Cellulomonas cellasea]|uniref:YqjF family protein n=1 Tax=Cellulomonas cellasea TaxID=43670 RepID=UPI0025A36715|nr:DUF2071 domain-containing protein [Cellulomonas cellasea]MDM8083985.1 DUF2071 domain-containing protein [Cellulomonas cellasea]
MDLPPPTVSRRHPERHIAWPVNAQRWTELTFAHWRYDPDVVQRLLPAGLEAQVLDGSAWVGLVPFRMGGVRTPPLPPIPVWSDFPELNVRTYVRGPDGREGVWFFSLACPRRAFVAAMRCVGLRYEFARAQIADAGQGTGSGARYRFHGRGAGSRPEWRFDARATVGEPLGEGARTPLVDSLTARWAAYSRVAGRLWRIPISHEPWPLHEASLAGELVGPIAAVGLPAPDGAPLVHYSSGVESRIGLPSLVG